MRANEFLIEAKPENLGQGMIDKLLQSYQTKDKADHNQFQDGMSIANELFKASGPNYLVWVAKQYNNDQYFFLHDLPQWEDTLSDYTKVKQLAKRDPRIQIEQDINKFTNINQLRQSIQKASDITSEQGSKYYDRVINGTDNIPGLDSFVRSKQAQWLYKGSDYAIYYPMTWEASNAVQKIVPTKVSACVAASDSLYDLYKEGGEFFYIIGQDNSFVSYVRLNSEYDDDGDDGDAYPQSEFSDVDNNHDYDIHYQITHYPRIIPILNQLKNENTGIEVELALEPDPAKKIKLCKAAVLTDGNQLQYVPDELKTAEICKIAVSSDGTALQFVPASVQLQLPELCKQAVQQSGMTLQYVPKKLKTAELCKIAVTQQPFALQYVPASVQLQIPELCKQAVSNAPYMLRSLDQTLLTAQLCKQAVQQSGITLQFVPKNLLTPELCKLAVQQSGRALAYVPDELKTVEICELAVLTDGFALARIPVSFQTPEMCKNAVSYNGEVLKYVAPALKTPELCRIAVLGNPGAFSYVPENLLTPELYKEAVLNNRSALAYVPQELKTLELCKLAITAHGINQKLYIPGKFHLEINEWLKSKEPGNKNESK